MAKMARLPKGEGKRIRKCSKKPRRTAVSRKATTNSARILNQRIAPVWVERSRFLLSSIRCCDAEVFNVRRVMDCWRAVLSMSSSLPIFAFKFVVRQAGSLLEYAADSAVKLSRFGFRLLLR